MFVYAEHVSSVWNMNSIRIQVSTNNNSYNKKHTKQKNIKDQIGSNRRLSDWQSIDNHTQESQMSRKKNRLEI